MPESASLPFTGIDHLHLLVGNAKQAAYYYRAAFGFRLTAYRGPETGTREAVSYLLEQGAIRLVLSTPLGADSPMHEHIQKHGDGVRDIAFLVDDPASAWTAALAAGAEAAYDPSALEDDDGLVRMAGIKTFGHTIHTFLSRREYRGAFRPGFVSLPEADTVARPAGLTTIETISACVPAEDLERWKAFYQHLPGNCRVCLNDATAARTQEFLDAYSGAGVACVAFGAADPAAARALLRAQGVDFQSIADRPTLTHEIVSHR